MRSLLLMTLLISHISFADSWDDIRFYGLPSGRTYQISSGSGFFINLDTIVTNKHVVEDCKNIAIRGAVKPTLAKLILINDEKDLALLQSPVHSKRVPYLRNNHKEIKIGDILFSIGYPLNSSETGEFVIKEGKVLKIKTHNGSDSENIEFTDNINHGNSGGPLLDKNSNLVGVVTAKMIYQYNDINIPNKEVAIAISVRGLIKFLKDNNIYYASSSSYDIFTNYHVDKLAKDYVVNIHCVK